jgi:type I restriction enzyme M protein
MSNLPKGWIETKLGQIVEIVNGIAGFCKSATLEEIAEHDFVLTPGRYVGIVHEEDDDTSFEEKMKHLTSTLAKQMEQEKILDDEIKEQLSKIGYTL